MKKITSVHFACLILIALISNSCSVNKAKIDNDLQQYFDSKNARGCFTMLNNSNGEITVYNMSLDTSRYTPSSSFSLLHTLIALQVGVVTDDKMIIKWDNISRTDSLWNRDMNIVEAFKSNNVPFYQEVARRIGKATMQKWIDSISYGNKKIIGPIDSFWINNKLKVSPDEQLGFLKKLYFDQLPFRKSVQLTLRKMMIQEDNSAYSLSYKTAEGLDEKKQPIAWAVGWIEENRHVYFFSTLIELNKPSVNADNAALNITKDILSHYEFFKGKK